MESQITSSCRKAYFHLRRIARIRRFLSRSALCQFVHALVLSQLDYGNCLLVGLPATSLVRLQRVQNSAARLISGVRLRESITPTLRSLHWLPIYQRIEFKIAVLVFAVSLVLYLCILWHWLVFVILVVRHVHLLNSFFTLPEPIRKALVIVPSLLLHLEYGILFPLSCAC
jgi:hypothetical protein